MENQFFHFHQCCFHKKNRLNSTIIILLMPSSNETRKSKREIDWKKNVNTHTHTDTTWLYLWIGFCFCVLFGLRNTKKNDNRIDWQEKMNEWMDGCRLLLLLSTFNKLLIIFVFVLKFFFFFFPLPVFRIYSFHVNSPDRQTDKDGEIARFWIIQ